MADTTYTDGITLLTADTMNDLNRLHYTILGDPADVAAVNTALGLGTASSPQFAGVNIGHANDTTLTRVSPGVAAIEGVNILTTATGALKGANSDITSLSALSTPLSVDQGGTGAATLTANNVLLGNGTSAPQAVAPSTSGNVLTSNGTTWTSAAPVTQNAMSYALTSDVALTNTSTYFDGPYVIQGISGTWFVTGSVNLRNTAASSNYSVKLWDGTTVIASAHVFTAGANVSENVTLSGIITNPAGNLRISVKDNNYTVNTAMRFNQSGNSKDSVISAFRIG